jgi:hypothetical protein
VRELTKEELNIIEIAMPVEFYSKETFPTINFDCNLIDLDIEYMIKEFRKFTRKRSGILIVKFIGNTLDHGDVSFEFHIMAPGWLIAVEHVKTEARAELNSSYNWKEDLCGLDKGIIRWLEEGLPFFVELGWYTPDGKKTDKFGEGVPIRDAKGEIIDG